MIYIPKIRNPGSIAFNEIFFSIIIIIIIKRGNQIIVGFIVKAKIPKASKLELIFVLPKISLIIIKEKIKAGRSGLGDWLNSSIAGT
ncbi:MAG: hypothetical protein RSA74_12905, partial [Chryseobacterium sp.]